MDAATIEGLAVELYERLGFDPVVPVDAFRLARRLLGPQAIERGTSIVGLAARLFVSHGQRRIAVNRRLSVPYQQHAVGHELGHVVCDELGYHEDDLEQVCDAFGAAVLAPLPAVRAMLRAFGRDLGAMADEVASTETWAALRIGEATGTPIAVVTPQRVRVRGPDGWVWPDESTIRGWARRPLPGVRLARLTDDPRRVVLEAEDAG